MGQSVSYTASVDPAESMHFLIATPKGKTPEDSTNTKQWSLLHMITTVKKLIALK